LRLFVPDPYKRSPSLASFIDELAADPDAAHWAKDCRWVPGAGHCLSHPCRAACLFRRRKEAEATALMRSRRERRRCHQRFVRRVLSRTLPSLCVSCLPAVAPFI
jgi:hypothetical protein